MKEPELDGRHCDKNGEVSHKHGNTQTKTLRKIYGPGFGTAFHDTYKLSDAVVALDEPSLTRLIQDYIAGLLGAKTVAHQ